MITDKEIRKALARDAEDSTKKLVFITKDSGLREEWDTGSKRDSRVGKGRYDLLPPHAIRRLAQLYERGADKYGDRNWEQGQPLSRYLDSGMRHLFAVLNGEVDEDHAAAVVWNLMGYMETKHRIEADLLPESLNDM